MVSIAKKFELSVDAEMERMFGPEAVARWHEVSKPVGPEDAVPGSEDMCDTTIGGQAWPVSQEREE